MTVRKIKSLACAVCIFSVLLLVGMRAFAATEPPADSLFFTPDETKQINILAGKNVPTASGHPDIHLGAVMYYGPGDWTLWLQGERWTPATEHADLHVIDVKPDEVHLSVIAAPDTPPRDITLRPHQTYQLATGKVVEGAP